MQTESQSRSEGKGKGSRNLQIMVRVYASPCVNILKKQKQKICGHVQEQLIKSTRASEGAARERFVIKEERNGSAGYLGGEPRHDMERRLDELHRRLQQQRDAQAARADARDGQPDDPDDCADDGDEEGEEREGQAEQKPERPAPVVVVAVAAAATAAHL